MPLVAEGVLERAGWRATAGALAGTQEQGSVGQHLPHGSTRQRSWPATHPRRCRRRRRLACSSSSSSARSNGLVRHSCSCPHRKVENLREHAPPASLPTAAPTAHRRIAPEGHAQRVFLLEARHLGADSQGGGAAGPRLGQHNGILLPHCRHHCQRGVQQRGGVGDGCMASAWTGAWHAAHGTRPRHMFLSGAQRQPAVQDGPPGRPSPHKQSFA